MIVIRAVILLLHGEVQDAAYWTIIGRADDFLLGIAAFHSRSHLRGNHWIAATTAAAFLMLFWLVDEAGGFYQIGKSSPLWIIWPTIEAAAYAILIGYYDTSFAQNLNGSV